MKRWAMVVLLAVCAMGCTRTYTYTYYEVVHTVDEVQVGDTVELKTRDEVLIKGTVVRVNEQEVVVTSEDEGRRRVPWAQILVLRTVKKEKVVE